MNDVQTSDERLRALLRELAEVVDVVEIPEVPSRDLVPTRAHASDAVAVRRLTLSIAAALIAVLAVAAGTFVALRDRSSDSSSSGGDVVVGSPADFPEGSVTPFPQFGFFIVHDARQGMLALAMASPFRPGCGRVVELAEYRLAHPNAALPGPTPVFVDSCTALGYGPTGLVTNGPAASRGLFRYDTSEVDGQLVVRTDLLRPGPFYFLPAAPKDPTFTREGVRDRAARDVGSRLERIASDASRNEGPTVIVLGAFHDVRSDVITIPVLVGNAIGTVRVSSGAGPGAGAVTFSRREAARVTASIVAPSGSSFELDVTRIGEPAVPADSDVEFILQLVAQEFS